MLRSSPTANRRRWGPARESPPDPEDVEILADGEPSALAWIRITRPVGYADVEILADGEPSALAADRARADDRDVGVEILADGEPSALASCGGASRSSATR